MTAYNIRIGEVMRKISPTSGHAKMRIVAQKHVWNIDAKGSIWSFWLMRWASGDGGMMEDRGQGGGRELDTGSWILQ